MNRFGFVVSTLMLGTFLHVVLNRYIAVAGIGPDIFLLFVVANGFLLGPLMGETFGFCWGLMADAMGVNLFGLQTFLFSLIGYLVGNLRRRVDSERPAPQVVIAVVTTVFYAVGGVLIRHVLEQSSQRTSILSVVGESLFNAPFSILVFWISDQWVRLWKVNREQL